MHDARAVAHERVGIPAEDVPNQPYVGLVQAEPVLVLPGRSGWLPTRPQAAPTALGCRIPYYRYVIPERDRTFWCCGGPARFCGPDVRLRTQPPNRNAALYAITARSKPISSASAVSSWPIDASASAGITLTSGGMFWRLRS